MRFLCPHCSQKLQTDGRLAGKVVSCPSCGRHVTVPQPSVVKREATETQPSAQGVDAKRNTPPSRAAAERDKGVKGASWQRVDSTNVSIGISFGIGLAFAAGLYLLTLLASGTYIADLFWKRGWVPYVLSVLMGWSVGLLLLKWRRLKRQKQVMLLDVLPLELGEEICVDNVQDFLDKVLEIPARSHESFMVRRMLLGLRHFMVRRSNPEVASLLESQAQIDAAAVNASYSLLKVFIWAIPILGFIGTVIGISSAVSGFSGSLQAAESIDVLKTSLNNVTLGLAVAFDTTLLALVMSLLVSIPASAMQKAEQDLLGWVDEYCNEHLLKRINDAGGMSDVAQHTESIMEAMGHALAGNQTAVIEEFRAVQDNMAEIQKAQGDALSKLVTAVDAELTSLEARAAAYQETLQGGMAETRKEQERAVNELVAAMKTQLTAMEARAAAYQGAVEASLVKVAQPVERGIESLLNKAGTIERKAAESIEHSAREFGGQLKGVTQGLEALNRVLEDLGEKQVVIRQEKPGKRFGLFGAGRGKQRT